MRIATEGALLGSLIAHGVSPEMGVLSDGAGQFDVFVHALCWLHVERPLERLVPYNEKHRQAIERVRQRIWDLYKGLKAYQQAPSLTARDALAKQFDELVADRTDYPSIDGVLKGMAADRAKLLRVLERPEVPLHNNLSEGHIRDYVKKRKISGSTRSDSGRRARDTFASLKKTCRRLGVNFWEYLQDRVRGLGKVPRLADLIRQKAEEAAARRAPAAPPPDPDGGAGGLNAGSGLRCLVSALRLRGTTRRIPCPVFLRSYENTPLVGQLLEIIRTQQDRIQQLEDEILRLKGLKTRPVIAPSPLEPPPRRLVSRVRSGPAPPSGPRPPNWSSPMKSSSRWPTCHPDRPSKVTKTSWFRIWRSARGSPVTAANAGGVPTAGTWWPHCPKMSDPRATSDRP